MMVGDWNVYLGTRASLPSGTNNLGAAQGRSFPHRTPKKRGRQPVPHPQARGRWLANIINTMGLVVLNGRERNIAPYKHLPYTYIQNTTGPSRQSESIIDYALVRKQQSDRKHLCRVMHQVCGVDGQSAADHELIVTEVTVPCRGGANIDPARPRQEGKPTKRLKYNDHTER